MKRNVGSLDRTVRVVVGIALLGMLALDSSFRWLGLIGLVPLLTAALGSCPLYSLMGLSTCPVDTARRGA
jgi:hypothetical protein